MRWLIDYDSTVADTQSTMLEHCNSVFGTNYIGNDIKSWATEDFLPLDYVKYMWGASCWLNEEIQAAAKPVEGALKGINNLLKGGNTMMIVSDRPPALFEVTRDWLDRHGLADIRLLFTRHRNSMHIEGKEMTKLQVAYLYKLRMMVDDSPHHPVEFDAKSYVDQIYLLDMPYNQLVQGRKIERVKNWDQIPTERALSW